MSVAPLTQVNGIKKTYRDVLGYKDKTQMVSISFDCDITPIEYIPLTKSGDILNIYPKDKAGILFYTRDTKEQNS